MKVIDPGHEYELDSLDGEQSNRLVFVKREGGKFPGNVGHHPGTNIQEVLRALIDRCLYVNNQIYSPQTATAIYHMRNAILVLEQRAAIRHRRKLQRYNVLGIEHDMTCSKCGHIEHDCTKRKGAA